MNVGELLVALGLPPSVAAVGFSKFAVRDAPEPHQLCVEIKALTYGPRKWTDLEEEAFDWIWPTHATANADQSAGVS